MTSSPGFLRETLYHMLSSCSPVRTTLTGIERESSASKFSVIDSGIVRTTLPYTVVAFSGTSCVPAARTLARSSVTCTFSAFARA